jgi:hypothetical protein
MTTPLAGNWVHLSFRNDLPGPNGEPLLAAPWAPPGQFQVTTDANGAVTGTLVFPRGFTLTVTGQVSEAVAAGLVVPWPLPPSVELTALHTDQVSGKETEYRLRGWFIPQSNVIVGTVKCVKNDLAQAPDGTLGPWVLTKVA